MCYKEGGANADTGSSANDHLTMNSTRLALEAASLQGIEGENAHIFNNVCDLYEIARACRDKPINFFDLKIQSI